ncbi:hypothetical protein PsYK624_087210 [Phanerochaete sordida]|uniref:F-box domain-containing protein n=1 Tax=Phanerochaete sordida TaxID=48140 RepID=A0A9P3GD40_9APHY|nr:hypothetical protein PsYK624_087210 [Phanerochaete sordida]
MLGGFEEILHEIMAYLEPGPPGLLLSGAADEYRARCHTLGQCACVSRLWHQVSLWHLFRHPVITLRDPAYSPNARTIQDFLMFIRQPSLPRQAFRSLILRNDNYQLAAAFQAGGMEGAFSVNFSATMQDIADVVNTLEAMTTLKLCYFTLPDVSQVLVPEIAPAFDRITHFTYAGRREVGTGVSMTYVELCTLLSCFRSLEELVLDDIDMSADANGGALPVLAGLRKLIIHRSNDVSALAADLLTQVNNGDLLHLHHFELSMINPENQLVCQQLITALAPQLTILVLGHDHAYSVADYLATLSFPLDFQHCPLLTDLRIVLDLSDRVPELPEEDPRPSEAFEHLAVMLASAAAPADTVRTLTIEYGEAPATVARGDEANVELEPDAASLQRIDSCLVRRFAALRAVRFVPLREYEFETFPEVDRRVVRESFRGLDLKGLLKF